MLNTETGSVAEIKEPKAKLAVGEKAFILIINGTVIIPHHPKKYIRLEVTTVAIKVPKTAKVIILPKC